METADIRIETSQNDYDELQRTTPSGEPLRPPSASWVTLRASTASSPTPVSPRWIQSSSPGSSLDDSCDTLPQNTVVLEASQAFTNTHSSVSSGSFDTSLAVLPRGSRSSGNQETRGVSTKQVSVSGTLVSDSLQNSTDGTQYDSFARFLSAYSERYPRTLDRLSSLIYLDELVESEEKRLRLLLLKSLHERSFHRDKLQAVAKLLNLSDAERIPTIVEDCSERGGFQRIGER